MGSVAADNSEYWDFICGSSAAKMLRIKNVSPNELLRFDEWYFNFYPYLKKFLAENIPKDSSTLEVGLGYGTVSECLYHGTPLIYIPRTYWPEGPVLEHLLSRFNAGIRMTEEDFFGGNWGVYLHQARSIKNSWSHELTEQLSPETAYDFIYREIEKVMIS